MLHKSCLVVEDSLLGVQTSKNLGIIVTAPHAPRFPQACYHQGHADYVMKLSQLLNLVSDTA
jgi:beta-phosphoglucomutase-like phosphatase (HAD superfamily)